MRAAALFLLFLISSLEAGSRDGQRLRLTRLKEIGEQTRRAAAILASLAVISFSRKLVQGGFFPRIELLQ